MTRRADRLLLLLEALRRSRVVTAATLAAALEVSTRTVYRDIEALISAGAPIRGEIGVGFLLEPGYFLPPVSLTPEEAEALALGARVLESWSDAPLAAAAAAAVAKIRAVLAADGQRAVDRDILWAPQWVTRQAPKADLLQLKRAAERRRVLEIAYETLNGSRSTRTVRPLAVSFFGPVWLLVAWCELREDFRCFRLDRIHACHPTGATFRDEPGKQLRDFKRRKGEEALARAASRA
ncbi:MAG TPA: YafY family protein [Caulobacteraceae bacterium]|nr:YafY family protein [Caulobacteraceae bacterium]